ncbi:MAG TPA: carbon storage regulator [Peptococcaceae bacterium]|nr:carbon storage regulator [Peptococcaceae bacterium]
MLILSRKVGESMIIQDDIEIIVTEVTGDKVKLGIIAPKDVKVLRKELYLTVESNREAVQGVAEKQLKELMKDLKKSI